LQSELPDVSSMLLIHSRGGRRAARGRTQRVWQVALSCLLSLSLGAGAQAAQRRALPDIWQVGVVLQAPFAEYDASGHWLQGANIEVLNQLAANLRVRLVWHGYNSQEALDQAGRQHLIDIAPGQIQTPQSLRDWLFSEPYLRVPNKVVGLQGRGIRSVDLESLPPSDRVALSGPGALSRFATLSYPALHQVLQPSERAALQAVIKQQADYAVIDEAQLSILLRDPAFMQIAVVGDSGYTRLLRIAVRADRPDWADLIDTQLQQMPGRYFHQVYARWLLPDYPALTDRLAFWRALAILGILLALALGAGAWWQSHQRRSLEARLERAREVLERQEAEREALRLPQFSIDNSTVGILWVNWDSRIRYANLAALKLLGALQLDQLLGRALFDFYPALSVDQWHDLWNRLRGSATVANFEGHCVRLDGSSLPLDIALSFLRFGSAEYLVVFVSDASERHRARAALEESEARLQGIAANVPGLVFRLERAAQDAPLQLAFLSEAAYAMLGHAPQQLQRHLIRLPAWVYPQDRQDFLRSWRQALEGQGLWVWQGRMVTRAGRQRWIDLKASRRVFEDGRVVWDGIAWDISKNKHNELRLAESRQTLRELSAHLESVREEEKARIAREVHDELGQMLTVLRLEMSMCEIGFAELDPKLKERLHTMQRLIEQTFLIVRDVASALRPPILDAGIASAIEWQVRRFEARTQIPCLVSVPEAPLPLADGSAIGLFRILQEALTNVMRHAQAHSVTLVLAQCDGMLNLRISDDGVGFDTTVPHGVSFGLVGIRERVLLLNGTLEISSEPGQGTTLSVSVPMEQEEPA